ncbi:MAG: NAD(P)-dependent oxidoreductase [Legionellales bacterium]|nr:NAD(P)-dependent oxidoreductase [Legionellales bacterium]OUX65898.1 MAG: NAD(P)-dependent oxidoreductase [Gammaproteobacteria bacterium TMED281]|tara:strand:+ start:1086 stop:1958 length:873 start_codon:yes stop_codon:yes gene_type:complete
MVKKILIIGANGMLGGSLFRYLSKSKHFNVLGTVRSRATAEIISQHGFKNIQSDVDITEFDSVSSLMNTFQPHYVLNCVGLIKQLEAAKAPAPSIEINSLLPHRLAQACNAVDAHLIHFSTDCVFSGDKGMYVETDLPDANDLYGQSKLLGEVNYGPHLTLRTSIIGHELSKSVSLVDWFLGKKGMVHGYRKAIFSGMPTIYIAEFLQTYVFEKNISGLYHLSVDPIDKYSLLMLIKEQYDLNIDIVPQDDILIDRSLDSQHIRSKTGFVPPRWQFLVEKMRQEYLEYFI